MRITYLDGKRYGRAILAASLWVNEKQQRLNDINVYPVPDGDTTPISPPSSIWLALGITAGGTVVLGILPGLVLRFADLPDLTGALGL